MRPPPWGLPAFSELAARFGLEVLAEGWWRTDRDGPPPPLPGFVMSTFSPMVVEACERCLAAYDGVPPLERVPGDAVGVLVVSGTGDLDTNEAIAAAVDGGRRVPPLLFYQSVPNVAAGYVARRWGLRGPVVSTSPVGEPGVDVFEHAGLLLDDEALAALVVVRADQSGAEGGCDWAQAVLLSRV